MSESPSTNGVNGRVNRGRFAKGNPGGPGNPHAKRCARLRAALYQAVTPQDLKDVVTALLTAAKGGDVSAARELMQRLLGSPVEWDFIERLEALERRLAAEKERGPTW